MRQVEVDDAAAFVSGNDRAGRECHSPGQNAVFKEVKLAAGFDRGAVRLAAAVDIEMAVFVDRGAFRQAAVGDIEKAVFVDRGLGRRAAGGDP